MNIADEGFLLIRSKNIESVYAEERVSFVFDHHFAKKISNKILGIDNAKNTNAWLMFEYNDKDELLIHTACLIVNVEISCDEETREVCGMEFSAEEINILQSLFNNYLLSL